MSMCFVFEDILKIRGKSRLDSRIISEYSFYSYPGKFFNPTSSSDADQGSNRYGDRFPVYC